jgi:hypothetical protein
MDIFGAPPTGADALSGTASGRRFLPGGLRLTFAGMAPIAPGVAVRADFGDSLRVTHLGKSGMGEALKSMVEWRPGGEREPA